MLLFFITKLNINLTKLAFQDILLHITSGS